MIIDLKNTLILLGLVGVLAGPGCSSGNPAVRNYYTTPDRSSGEIVWREEIRAGDGTTAIGFLEKQTFQPADKPGERYVYFVYDRNFDDPAAGFILDTGRTFLHRRDAETRDLGVLGLKDGVRRLLNHRDDVQFYRRGRQVFHN